MSPVRRGALARGAGEGAAGTPESSSAQSETTSSPSPSLSAPTSDESTTFPRAWVQSRRARAQPQLRTAPNAS